MEHFIFQFLHLNPTFLYLIIFVAVLIEGELTLLVAGMLIKHRSIEYFDTLIVIFIALLIHDTFYWNLGRWLANSKKEKILKISKSRLEKTLAHFKKQNGFYIIISKYAWGLNRFVIMANGYFKTKFSHFIKYSIFGGIVWTISFISLGYMFAEKMKILKRDVRIIGISIALLFIFIILIERSFRKALNEQANVKEDGLLP